LASEHSLGAKILDAAEKRRMVLLLGKPVLAEYRSVRKGEAMSHLCVRREFHGVCVFMLALALAATSL